MWILQHVYVLSTDKHFVLLSGDVQRNEGKEAWGMGLNFKFPWQKKKDKETADKAKAKK